GQAPPVQATPLGDTVQWRIERLLQQGQSPVPRCIDPAPEPVVAEIDTGGQISASAVSSIVASDSGMLFIVNMGMLGYLQRPHLAAQVPMGQPGPAALNRNPSFTGGAYPWTAQGGTTLTLASNWSVGGTTSGAWLGNGSFATPGILSENIYGIMAGTTYTAST